MRESVTVAEQVDPSSFKSYIHSSPSGSCVTGCAAMGINDGAAFAFGDLGTARLQALVAASFLSRPLSDPKRKWERPLLKVSWHAISHLPAR
jgi:hypothetical protein